MKASFCLIYAVVLVLIFISVYNNKEDFKVSLSDNKDNSYKPKRYRKKLDNVSTVNNYSLDNMSKIRDTGVAVNFGGYGNNSDVMMYDKKGDGKNYLSMVQDLDVNYIDPNMEVNEKCSPPGLCDIQKIKNQFTCGCGSNIGQNFTATCSKEPIIESFDNYDNTGQNGVFFTDYGGGEKYIPCGECQDGFVKNMFGKCEKRCKTCKTYKTTHKNMLLNIVEDRRNRHKGCGDCDCCGECSGCDNQCNCSNKVQMMCDNCMRCSKCNKCNNKSVNNYLNGFF